MSRPTCRACEGASVFEEASGLQATDNVRIDARCCAHPTHSEFAQRHCVFVAVGTTTSSDRREPARRS
eukprot:1182215-Prorocentrum_minimum.AAC.1